jgi:hypothetical protein
MQWAYDLRRRHGRWALRGRVESKRLRWGLACLADYSVNQHLYRALTFGLPRSFPATVPDFCRDGLELELGHE